MLRYIYTLCDLLSSACALLSPVIVFHWLFKVVDLAPLRSVITMGDSVCVPLDSLLEMFIKLPPITYAGHVVPTTQALLAVILTCFFFLFNFLSETFKVSEQRLNVQVDATIQRRRLQKLREEQQRKEAMLPQNLRIFVFVEYDSLACLPMGDQVEKMLQREGGHIHSRMAHELALEFKHMENALRFALDVSQTVLAYYATLRPIEPRPPFRMSIHGVDNMLNISTSVAETHKLIQYVMSNQIIVSQTAKALLDASGTLIPYRLQSIGIYSMDNGAQRELFKLFAGKQATSY